MTRQIKNMDPFCVYLPEGAELSVPAASAERDQRPVIISTKSKQEWFTHLSNIARPHRPRLWGGWGK